MHRFFVPPSWIRGDEVTIRGSQALQIFRVLRMRPGDEVIVLDNSGWEIHTQLVAVDPNEVRGEVLRRRLAGGEPRTKISLFQGVLRSSSFEIVLQKGSELGVIEFIPIITDRCVVRDLDAVESKRRRWEWIIQESAEQCRRGRKPLLRPAMLFPQACEQARHVAGLSLIPWEESGPSRLGDALGKPPPGHERNWPPLTVNLFIGPEGGFTVEEMTIARRYGLVPVTLGPRILRAETAAVAAVAIILYQFGNLD
jgi:16S rRNA (uracil1498-N3)-methyltransferase